MAPFLNGTASSTATLTAQDPPQLSVQPISKNANAGLEARKSALLESIAAIKHDAELFAHDPHADKALRYEVRSAAVNLADTFEQPVEQALRTLFEAQPPLSAMRIAIEGKFVQPLLEASPQSADSLGQRSGADPVLIVRIMRLMSAAKMVDEVDVNTYAANDLTKAFLQPGICDAVIHGCDIVNIIFSKLPEFLTSIEFKDPASYQAGAHFYSFGKPLWKHLELEPQRSAMFDKMMMAFKKNRESFVDIFPFQQRAAEAGSALGADQVLIIDIAGGIGHRLKEFRAKHSNIPGRALLQDLPHVLPTEKSNPVVHAGLVQHDIEMMAHDIFTTQPIKHARYYFFSAIFHGRPDGDCIQLLRNVAPAMDMDSRILINDFVIPDKGANLFHSAFDMWMMAEVAGKERTLTQWTELAAAAGLRFVQAHQKGTDAVVEMALPEGGLKEETEVYSPSSANSARSSVHVWLE